MSQPPPGAGDSPLGEAIHRKLRFLVTTHHVTLPDLADYLATDVGVLHDILDGRTLPSRGMLEALAERFEVSPEFFGLPGPQEVEALTQAAGAPARTPRRRARRRSLKKGKSRRSSVSLRPTQTLAVRHQALLEVLIQKRALTAAEYHQRVREIEERAQSPRGSD